MTRERSNHTKRRITTEQQSTLGAAVSTTKNYRSFGVIWGNFNRSRLAHAMVEEVADRGKAKLRLISGSNYTILDRKPERVVGYKKSAYTTVSLIPNTQPKTRICLTWPVIYIPVK